MALQRKIIGNESLENMNFFNSGGFGDVFKAKYKDLGIDVAIKTPRGDSSSLALEQSELWREVSNMLKVASPFVVSVYGIYKGSPGEGPVKQGIVMEFMDKGSIESLCKALGNHPPPWPLAFRLALQVARGMNFLHSWDLLHQDLKPSNVLLDKDLNAKIADLGFTCISTSTLRTSNKNPEVQGGSDKYTPPEAFGKSYEPVRAYDIYSYGILLWFILTGQEPYPGTAASVVRTVVTYQNARPPINEIDQTKADGLQELVELMQRCWRKEPSERPKFKECIDVTESVFKRHEEGIHDAVGDVLKKLSGTVTALSQPHQAKPGQPEQSNDTVDRPRFAKPESSFKQDSVDVRREKMSEKEKANFADKKRSKLIQSVSMVMPVVDELVDQRMVHSESYSRIRALKTNQERIRELYDTALHSGGEKVKAAFYDALIKHEPRLMEQLGA